MVDSNKRPSVDQVKPEVPVVEPVVEPTVEMPKEKKPEIPRVIVDEVKQV